MDFTSKEETDNILLSKKLFQQSVEKRAYFIWKDTGCQDSSKNYFQALQSEQQQYTQNQSDCPFIGSKKGDDKNKK